MVNSFKGRKIQIFTNLKFTSSLQLMLKLAEGWIYNFRLGNWQLSQTTVLYSRQHSLDVFHQIFWLRSPQKICALLKGFLRRTTLSTDPGADHCGRALCQRVLPGCADTVHRTRTWSRAQEKNTHRNGTETDAWDGRTNVFVWETPARDAGILPRLLERAFSGIAGESQPERHPECLRGLRTWFFT